MHISYCFPTAIFNTVDEKLADRLLPIALKYLNDESYINKNITIYKTTWKPDQNNYHDLDFFNEYICDLGKDFLRKQGYQVDSEKFIASFFLNEMYDVQGHPPHTHPNHSLSGVIYLQTPPGSAPISFYDPKPRRYFIRREVEFETETNMNKISIEPRKGLLLMWESWLEHSVEKNRNVDEGRISLVFNLTSLK
jgi:uncharacterized protein (TIGR02466 family)